MNNLMQKLNQKRYLYSIFLLISILVVLLVNWHPGYAFSTGDYRFHINRIGALTTSIQHFNFLPKVDEYFAGGYGYAASLFYPDIFLYPAAILRLLGVPVLVTYLLTQVGINFFTLFITYIAGKRLNFSTKNNLIFTFIYFLSTYRLQVLYSRQDLGELMGMIFFPLVLSELLKFKKGDTNEWYIFSFAMIGIGLSHLISLFMILCFCVLFVLLNIKYFWNKNAIRNILKAAGLTIGIVFGIYAPILEQMISQDFTVSTDPLIRIYEETQPLTELVAHSFSNQVFHAGTVNIGFVIFIGLVVYTIYNFIKCKNISLTLIALFLFISCTQFFPWYSIRNSIFASFQFPWRFFSLISLIVAYFIANDDLNLFKIKYATTALMVGLMGLTVAFAQFTTQASPWRMNQYSTYNNISTYLIGAGHEYLPCEINYNEIKTDEPRLLGYDSTDVSVSHKEITNNNVKFSFNTKNKDAKVVLPLFFYKGYQAKVTGTGSSTTPVLNNDNGQTKIYLNGSGTVSVQYHYTTVQKLSLTVSLISTLYCFFIIWRRKQTMP
ncbi:hypothetical protein [Companilactobacillus ginsenosidimutans]|uniref:Membrane protein 6-pyruvoyl-tetrahydropterin synthase-related domain-containing protein n=1 Tax=Companilactobacillus ginsenosidimutans TaxID=1007676 RepID=A0A0H4QG17_9LACO|nr:hypothetical protein [Companilactobacillus ginsenosidimutans]AKP67359.1 hypothetical protein ABM34_07280 [Companilactobacillus ginsenosidimutans]